MVGQVTANNNSAASVAANAALAKGSATTGMYGSIAQGVGQIAGALGSSYGTPVNQPASPYGGGYTPYGYGGHY